MDFLAIIFAVFFILSPFVIFIGAIIYKIWDFLFGSGVDRRKREREWHDDQFVREYLDHPNMLETCYKVLTAIPSKHQEYIDNDDLVSLASEQLDGKERMEVLYKKYPRTCPRSLLFDYYHNMSTPYSKYLSTGNIEYLKGIRVINAYLMSEDEKKKLIDARNERKALEDARQSALNRQKEARDLAKYTLECAIDPPTVKQNKYTRRRIY